MAILQVFNLNSIIVCNRAPFLVFGVLITLNNVLPFYSITNFDYRY